MKTITKKEWKDFQSYGKSILDQAREQGVKDPCLGWEKRFLSECDLGERFHCETFGLEKDGQMVAVHMAYFAKKRRAGWGKYITSHYAYTLYGLRKLGYGSGLLAEVEAEAASRGYDRMKTLACSYGGFRLHCCRSQEVWGINDRGDLRIDTPLINSQGKQTMEFPKGVPWCARDVCKSVEERPSVGQILKWVTDPLGKFRGPDAEVREALKAHGYGEC